MDKCKFCAEYNGDGIEDTDGHDYYSCELLNERNLKKYGCYSSVDNRVDPDDCEYCLCDTCKLTEKNEELVDKETEEEKKAIDNLKFKLNLDKEDYGEEYIALYNLYDNIVIKTILNLIEKQKIALDNTSRELISRTEKLVKYQKEIEELKQENKYLNCICESDASNYINKEAIREKIKDVEENGYWDFLEKRDCETAIEILKELLGE